MNFGPLQYNDPKGLYDEDPAVQDMQAKMERALIAKATREIRKIIARHSWQFHQHGSMQAAMSLPVTFSVVTGADIIAIEKAAMVAAEQRLRNRVRSAIDEVLND